MMKKAWFVIIILTIQIMLIASEQLTLFGKLGTLKLDVYGLKVNTFDLKTALNDEQLLRICESIDNSMLVAFGNQLGRVQLQRVFSAKPVATSLKELLRRGGIIYFGPTNWDVASKVPPQMTRFFSEIKAAVAWNNKRYCKTAKGSGVELQVDASYGNDVPEKLRQPHVKIKEKSIRHFGDLSTTPLKPLLYNEKKQQVLATMQAVDKGYIVFNYAFTVHSKSNSPFMENLLSAAYGRQIKKLSPKQKLAKKTSTVSSQWFIDLNKPQVLNLLDAKTGTTPNRTTAVRVEATRKTLKLRFQCQGNPEKLRAVSQRRDESVWNDDCVEVLLSPGTRNDEPLYHFILNSRNVLYDAKNGNPAWNSKKIQTRARITETGFEADLDIDCEELCLKEFFRINLCREAKNPDELSSYRPAPTGFNSHGSLATAGFKKPESAVSSNGKLTIIERPVFERIYEDSEAPKGAVEVKQIKVLLAKGDRETAKIVLYNRSGNNHYFRIEPQAVKAGEPKFEIQEILPWRAINGTVFHEIITPLNGAGVITVPDGANVCLLISAETNGSSGVFNWGFELVPINIDWPKRKISIQAEVLELNYPENTTHIYTFGPYYASPERRRFVTDKKINWLMAYPPLNTITLSKSGELKFNAIDPEKNFKLEKELTAKGCNWVYHYGIWPDFCRKLKKLGYKNAGYGDEKTREGFRKFISGWAAAMRNAGIDFNRFYVPLQDEPRGKVIPELVFAGKVLHENNIRTCCTIATWSTLEEIKQLAPAVDLWITWEPRLTDRATAAEELEFIRSTGKPLMPYLCGTNGNTSDYLRYFRFRGIRTYKLGGIGFALWAANSWRGNPYYAKDDVKALGMWLFHHGAKEDVGTMRLEAFREGIEDFAWLKLAEKSGSPQVKSLISKEKLSKLQNSGSPETVTLWRNSLLRALAGKK